jgi:transposase
MYSDEFKRIAMRVYNRILSLREVACLFSIGKSTLQRWMTGTSKIQQKISKCTTSVAALVRTLLDTNPFVNMQTLSCKIFEMTGVKLSRQFTSTVVNRCGFSKKRTRKKAKATSPDDVETFRKSVENVNINNCVFVDETSLDHTDIPRYGYSRRGHRLTSIVGSKRNVKTLTLAMTSNEIVHHTEVPGASNTQHFLDFLNGLQKCGVTFVVMDNVRFHHSNVVKDACSKMGIQILYTPPYSPDFNPIENVFSIIKSKWRSLEPIKRIISDVLKTIPTVHLQGAVTRSKDFWNGVRSP